ncbi:bifunctional riboflavin kinase/FAD synthetase [Ahrensia marina]|uniref:bifunctional riboflavin kinase/FAD synthetase n=1 Tax=Ahrensia marina TaxID=1514904 RepID=UPI0035D00D11
MLLLRQPQTPPDPAVPRVVMIGNFDGFHRGHQAVAQAALNVADSSNGVVWLLTFDPHPRAFFSPTGAHNALASPAVEARLAAAIGLAGIYTMNFDKALSSQTPQAFIADNIVARMQADCVVVGHDFRFGQGRAGSAETLREHGGFRVVEVDAFADEGGQTVSSTRIRSLLSKGHLAEANGILGHRYFVIGTVEHGEKRGRELGYPTANIALDAGSALAHGIYATTVKVGETVYPSVASYGRRPTFGDKPPLLEVHLFDYSGDLYGQQLEVAFHSYLRPELKFDGVDALIAQMDKDSEMARAALASAQPLSQLDQALGLVHANVLAA